MRVNEVLRQKGDTVVTIEPNRTVRQLLARLAEHGVGALVVSRDGTTVEGIVSERDVVRRLHDGGRDVMDGPIALIMTTDVRTCSLEDSLHDLMPVMTEQRIRHLPVLADGRMVGIVSIGDVVKNLISEVEAERDQLTSYITG